MKEEVFMLGQPDFPARSISDRYYYKVACRLEHIIESEKLLPDWEPALLKRVAIALTGYLQDVSIDSGLWRSFIERHNSLYGAYLPFYSLSEEYIPHELNPEDVRFIVWYTLALNSDGAQRVCNPLDEEIAEAADVLHAEMNKVYEDPDAPSAEDYFTWRGLELNNREETDDVFKFGNWLFMHCWLMTPAFAMTLAEILANPDLEGGHNAEKLRHALEEAMMEIPTGPLALYLHEWIFLILEGKMPPTPKTVSPEDTGEHPYYTRFMTATGGKPVMFFKTYAELNNFFADALGWGDGDNLPALKESSDFVLLVNKHKGMLCAKDVAKCIKLEGNPCYDAEYARTHAFELLSQRGRCPGDLLQFIFNNNALPDAHFPGSDDTQLVENNRDFIARIYLQKYYRGD